MLKRRPNWTPTIRELKVNGCGTTAAGVKVPDVRDRQQGIPTGRVGKMFNVCVG